MSDYEEPVDSEPPAIDPYDVLGLERNATEDQIKSAYRKAALKNHPDKVPEDQKTKAHTDFQSIVFAYAVLSDPVRRKRYDATGSTSDSIVDSDGFDWSEYYRELFRDAISADAIEKFSKQYKNSDEERDDVLVAYEAEEGNMDAVYERVMVSNVLEDDDRFRSIIDRAIAEGDVPAFKAYAKETKKKREGRLKAARKEAREAEDYAKELGVHDKLFAGGKNGKPKKAKDAEADLAALIQRNQRNRAGFLDNLAEKYGAKQKPKPKQRGRKRRVTDDDDDENEIENDEPSEDAFRANAAKLQSAKDARAADSSRKRRKR